MADLQYWDNILYPSFRATIRGEYYGIISQDDLDEECYNIACRAIAAFKFPKISTAYETFYAIRNEETNAIEEVEEDDENFENAIPHGRFLQPVGYEEVEVILAWMKVFWCEHLLSNSDNFDGIYTDSNIKTFSPANLVDKNTNLLKVYRENAKDIENRYSRVNTLSIPSIGDENSDE